MEYYLSLFIKAVFGGGITYVMKGGKQAADAEHAVTVQHRNNLRVTVLEVFHADVAADFRNGFFPDVYCHEPALSA